MSKRPAIAAIIAIVLALVAPLLVQSVGIEPVLTASDKPEANSGDCITVGLDGAPCDTSVSSGPSASDSSSAVNTTTPTTFPKTPTTTPPKNVKAVCGTAKDGASCGVKERTDMKGKEPAPTNGGEVQAVAHANVGNGGAYDPAYLRSAYNLNQFPSNAGSGRTVAVITAYDDPTLESDLAAYRSHFNLPACTIASGCLKKVNQNGQTSPLPAADANWANETSLDVDMVSAICPNCKILVVEGNNSGFGALGPAVNTAAAMGANAINNSYGAAEFSSETSMDSYYNHPGILITASTGDSGYGVSYPAASPNVVAVGGTSLHQADSNGTRNATETVWAGAGSGCSKYETKPSWQKDTGCTKRSDADVAAVADPATGVWIYYAGQWHVVGGTSASSPIVAAIGMLHSTIPTAQGLYSASLIDITSGSNGSCGTYLCNGAVGFDGPTGLGVFNGTSTFGADFTLTASPASQSVTRGSGATFTANITAVRSYSGSPTVSVSGAPTGTTVSDTTITVPTSAPAGTYAITVTATDGTRTHTTTVNLVIRDYTMTASASSITIPQGKTGTVKEVFASDSGYASKVNITATGMPTGMTLKTPAAIAPTKTGAPSTLTFATTAAVPTGTYPVNITATSTDAGAATRTNTVNIVVTGFALTAGHATVSAAGGGSTTNTAHLVASDSSVTSLAKLSFTGLPRGVTVVATTPTAPTTSGADIAVTFNVASTAVPGSTTVTMKATATNYPVQSTTFTFTVNGATVSGTSATITHGTSGTADITVTPVGTYGSSATMTFGALPKGITLASTPSPMSVGSSPKTVTLTFNVAATAAKTTVKIPVKIDSAGYPTQTATITLTVN